MNVIMNAGLLLEEQLYQNSSIPQCKDRHVLFEAMGTQMRNGVAS